jgi:hypothetical protein
MQCCGDPFATGSTVTWTLEPLDGGYLAEVLGEEEAARLTGAEEHHGGVEGRESRVATGVVRTIDAVFCRFAPRDTSEGRALYPVRGTAVVVAKTSADGWERERHGPEFESDDIKFLGYVVDLDTTPASA